MFRTPLLLHTAPDGSPADEVGMFLIERLFTKVAHILSALIFDPTMKDLLHPVSIVLHSPPRIAEKGERAMLLHPPPTVE